VPVRFQRFEILHDLIRNGDVIAYIDDFLVMTEALENLEVLDRVFRLLVENKSKINRIAIK